MMFLPQFRSMRPLAALAAFALLPLAGCGGGRPGVDEAIVEVEEPPAGAVTSANPAAPAAAAAAPESKAATTASTDTAPPVKAEGWGTLKGRVIFDGDAPAPKVEFAQGKAPKDPTICAVNGPVMNEKLVVDPKSKGVRNALVYIPKPTAINPEADSEARQRPLVFDQKGCVFAPHVLAAIKGEKVEVKSSDAVGHNVNPSAMRNPPFPNQTVPANGSFSIEIKNPDNRPGKVVCDIHPWMSAWWLTMNNPYFAVTDAEGNFEIKNVPAGTQKVVVWQESVHPKFVANGDPVVIKPGGEVTQDFKITPQMAVNQ
jgi:hypothetical protein